MEPKFRKKLNKKQLDLLHTLYRFRFLTVELANRLEGVDKTTTYSRLRNLLEQGYIDRRYDGIKQIRGEYAAYFLTRTGLHALKEFLQEDYSQKAGNNAAKDTNASDQFIAHCTEVLRLYCNMRDIYADIDFYTKNELNHSQYDYFPAKLPDAYATTEKAHFFVDFFDDTTPFFKLTRRIKEYEAYLESDKWQETGSAFPAVILVCANSAQQKRLQNKLPFMAQAIDFYTATCQEINVLEREAQQFRTTDRDRRASIEDIISSSLIANG